MERNYIIESIIDAVRQGTDLLGQESNILHRTLHPVHGDTSYTQGRYILSDSIHRPFKSKHGIGYTITVWVDESEKDEDHPHVSVQIQHGGKQIGNLSTYWDHPDGHGSAKDIGKYVLDRIEMCEEGRADWLFYPNGTCEC